MNLRIKRKLATRIGLEKFVPYGISVESWRWDPSQEIDLAILDPKKVTELEKMIRDSGKSRRIRLLLRDIEIWKDVQKNPSGGVKLRTLEQFKKAAFDYLKGTNGHRVYKKFDTDGDVWLPYYVEDIHYEPENHTRNYEHPAYTRINIVWEEFGGKKEKKYIFYEEDVRNKDVAAALAGKGFYAETEEFRNQHLKELELFNQMVDRIGKQYWAIGTGTDDLDGNPESDLDMWYWNKVHTVQLENSGQKSRVLIDVFYEDDKTEREGKSDNVHVNTWFWKRETVGGGQEENAESNIPVHPFLAVFDLTKHLRLRVHVNYLTEYIYDRKLAEKLVLPERMKNLVLLLLAHKQSAFQDIIKNKSGGAVVLLAGKPGTGKTLTAEVYAESEGRALYSIQCSQLGLTPDELENKLLIAFARTRRWNAVLLLDEADVYVHQRGNNLEQNAIVGVFLRVLEYQSNVLFLTTNRAQDVDDAIASRCIARLNYQYPTTTEQAQIWRILADGSGTRIKDSEIQKIVKANPTLSGRDVKNLLKLSRLIAGKHSVKSGDVEFAKQFKPTGDTE